MKKRKPSKWLSRILFLSVPDLRSFAIAYGILMNSKGYGFGWTAVMSLLAFAGSAQYAAITVLTSVFNPLSALLLTLVMNARHVFYGISLLDTFKDTGKLRPYLIFGLCDETFSIICSTEPPEGVNRTWFLFFITLLHHSYWVVGSAVGGLLGSILPFSTKGLDFVLTAFFLVIFLEQWKTQKNHTPAVIGVVCSLMSLALFGGSTFILPSMIAILAVLTVFRKKQAVEALQWH